MSKRKPSIKAAIYLLYKSMKGKVWYLKQAQDPGAFSAAIL